MFIVAKIMSLSHQNYCAFFNLTSCCALYTYVHVEVGLEWNEECAFCVADETT